MEPSKIARAFKQKVSREVTIDQEGIDRFVVYTPFRFDDGDHYVVILKRLGQDWMLTDEGHTFMHLSYDDVDLTTPTRASLVQDAIAVHGLKNEDGELRLIVPDSHFGDAL